MNASSSPIVVPESDPANPVIHNRSQRRPAVATLGIGQGHHCQELRVLQFDRAHSKYERPDCHGDESIFLLCPKRVLDWPPGSDTLVPRRVQLA